MNEWEKNHENSYEEESPTVKKKLAGEGGEWTLRRKKEQEDLADTSFVFGFDELGRWLFVHRRGSEYKKLVKYSGADSVFLEQAIKSREKRMAKDVKNINAQLVQVAEKNRGALHNVLVHYLYDVSDINKIAADLSFDYDSDEEANDLIDEEVNARLLRAFLKKEKPLTDRATLREQVRRKFIAEELAHVLANQYADGSERLDTPDMLMPMIEHHVKWVAEQEKEITRELASFKKRFRTLLARSIKTDAVPAVRSLTPAQINERLGILKFSAIDEFSTSLAEMWGDFQANTHTVRLSVNIPPDKRWKVFVHEMFHALSGQHEVGFFDEFPEFNMYGMAKVGTHFGDPFSGVRGMESDGRRKNKRRPVLHWLNEALTEAVTRDVLGDQYRHGTYVQERALLDVLKHAGVPSDILYRAYFENYAVKPAGEHRSPAMKELFQKTNELFGDGFLVKLDWYIRYHWQSADKKKSKSNGVEQALAEWKKRGAEFPHYIHQWYKDKAATND
ncbi:MAG: hypothetical protein AAB579_02920 [Patescibacteria group bacterium]